MPAPGRCSAHAEGLRGSELTGVGGGQRRRTSLWSVPSYLLELKSSSQRASEVSLQQSLLVGVGTETQGSNHLACNLMASERLGRDPNPRRALRLTPMPRLSEGGQTPPRQRKQHLRTPCRP